MERRYSPNEMFGQNRTASRQIFLPVRDFLKRLESKEGEFLYLSTQQPLEEKESSCSSSSCRISHAFQIPCRQLKEAKKLDETVVWAGNLRLESCNLWMGKSREGSSSGLHHDFHDNFYLLLQGRKRFRLYSPDVAPYMIMHGEIERIHFNGVISYKGKETRADGVPLALLKEEQKQAKKLGGSHTGHDRDFGEEKAKGDDDDTNDDDDYDDEEEEVVFGKGYDYKSSDDENDFDENADDDYDMIMENSKSANDQTGGGNEHNDDSSEDARPEHFCKFDPAISSLGKLSIVSECPSSEIELHAGQSLYLPAGWFHCVTSSGSEPRGDGIHMAINYWYHPPDALDKFSNPYLHNLPSTMNKI